MPSSKGVMIGLKLDMVSFTWIWNREGHMESIANIALASNIMACILPSVFDTTRFNKKIIP